MPAGTVVGLRHGARVQQYHCTGAQEQQWRLVLGELARRWLPVYQIISQRIGLGLGRASGAFDGEQARQGR